MNANDKPIITEDGQRLSVDDGAITGAEKPEKGLAFETGNTILNEPVKTNAQESTEGKDKA